MNLPLQMFQNLGDKTSCWQSDQLRQTLGVLSLCIQRDKSTLSWLLIFTCALSRCRMMILETSTACSPALSQGHSEKLYFQPHIRFWSASHHSPWFVAENKHSGFPSLLQFIISEVLGHHFSQTFFIPKFSIKTNHMASLIMTVRYHQFDIKVLTDQHLCTALMMSDFQVSYQTQLDAHLSNIFIWF
jgi:hypothetical protein